jgi:hypothetical protein
MTNHHCLFRTTCLLARRDSELRYTTRGRSVRLHREICRDAIRIVEVTLVTQNAWPELHKGTLYKRQILLEAVNALRANNKDHSDMEYKTLRDRISKDEKFIRTIGKWVSNFYFQAFQHSHLH